MPTLQELAQLSTMGAAPFVTGPLGQSPAIQAGLQAFLQNQLPVLQNQAGLAGLGRSPALLDAVNQGLVTAQVPLIQQGLQNRLTASGLLQGQQAQDVNTAATLAGIANQEATRGLNAANVAGGQLLGLGSNVLFPAAQGQQTQGLQGLQAIGQGGVFQQQTVQGLFDTIEQERLRRQALAEQGSFGTFGGNPSALASQGGQTVREVTESSGK